MEASARLTAHREGTTGSRNLKTVVGGLRGRLLILVILAAIPAIQGVIYHASVERVRLLELAKKDASNVLSDILVSAHLLVRGTEEILTTLAAVPQIVGADQNSCNRFIANLHLRHKTYANLGVIQPDGTITCSALPIATPVNVADREYFKQAVATRSFVAGGFQTGRISGEAVLVFAYPALNEQGQVRSVIFAALPLTWIERNFDGAKLPAGAIVNLIDAQNRLLARVPRSNAHAGRDFADAPLVKAVRSASGKGTAEVEGLDGIRRLFSFAPLPGVPAHQGIVVSVGLPLEAAYAEAYKSMLWHVGLIAITAVFVLSVAWWGGNVFVLRQVRGLQKASQRLAEGDLTARAELSGQHGELADLARAFNAMAVEIERRSREGVEHLERIRRLNRIHGVLSSINTTILRIRDPEQLLQEACRIAVEDGGLHFARVLVVS